MLKKLLTLCALSTAVFCSEVVEFKHPLLQHKLTQMRKTSTGTSHFHCLLKEIGAAMAYELTFDLPATHCTIETPLQSMDAPTIDGKKLCLVSVMRAGNGFLDGMRDFIPSARVGHIGIKRDKKTKQPIRYSISLPDIENRDVIIMDPMLATGGTAVESVNIIKEHNPRSIKFACLVTVPEGIEYFHSVHPDVPLYTVSIDERLDENAYILPGLGDAGDRIYGTK